MKASHTKYSVTAILFCVLIMTITAASDALRGVFLPEFRNVFSLTDPQSSRIIMMSYVGNLLFLFIGGYLSDRLPRRRFIGGLLLLWIAALAVHAFTENYTVLLMTIFFSLGASTMISTSVNMLTPLLFASPALMVNIFNFCQGIGLTGTQNVGGRFSDSIQAWHIANILLLSVAVICFILLMTMQLPDPERPKTSAVKTYITVLKSPSSWLLVLTCGGYYVAEHGLQNWLTSYGSEYLGFTVSKSAFYLSLFFGGVTVGRLIFAPIVQKLGVFRSMRIWALAAAVLYVAGFSLGKNGIWLIVGAGLAFSILYPMLVLLIGEFFDTSISGAATGFILSVATIFDVLFNACFGSLVEAQGYGTAILLLPAAACLMAVLLYVLRFGVKRSADIT